MAVTVILAAVIGNFVIGFGNQVQTTAPKATFTFDFDHEDGVMITHGGGESIDTNVDDLLVIHEGTSIASSGETPSWTDAEVTAGVGLEDRIDSGYNEGNGRVTWLNSAHIVASASGSWWSVHPARWSACHDSVDP